MRELFNDLKAPQTITVTKDEFLFKKLFLERSTLTMKEVDKLNRANRLLPSPHEITAKQHLNPEVIGSGTITMTILDKNYYTNVGYVYTVMTSTKEGINYELMLLSTYDENHYFEIQSTPIHKDLLN